MSVATHITKKTAIMWGTAAILSFGGYFLPLGDIYTADMKKFVFITIFGLCMMAFELTDNWVIAMLMPTAWILSGVTTFNVAFGQFGSMNFIMLLNAFIFAAVLSRTGLMNRIGYGLILKSGGTFYSGVWALFAVGIIIAVVSMGTNIVLTATLALAMMRALDVKMTDKAAVPIFTAVVLAVSHAKVIYYSPISIGIINASVQTIIPDFVFTYGKLLRWTWPMILFMLLFQWLVLKWYKVATKNQSQSMSLDEAKKYYKEQYDRLGQMSKEEKISTVGLICLFIWMITQSFHGLDITYAFIIANIAFFLVHIADNDCLKEVQINNIAVMMTFVSVGTVAAAINLTDIISGGVTVVFGSLGNYWSPCGTLIFGIVANLILSPYAMMSMLPSVVVGYCIDIGWSWLPHFLACYLASDLIFFPYEYPAILIVFAFGLCSMKNAIKMLTVKLILAVIFIIAIMMPYWNFLRFYS